MAEFSYLTVVQPGEGLYKEKGSKFLSFCFPVESEGEIKANLESLRKKYHDARHHCYAWILGADKSNYRANDDGEPNHSAGDPILGQIKSKNLTNVLVVVVRYFGGVKLGVGGLVNAYKTASEDALQKGGSVKKEITERVTINYTYGHTAEVMRLVRDFELPIQSQDFGEKCKLNTQLKSALRKDFDARVKLLQDTGSDIKLTT